MKNVRANYHVLIWGLLILTFFIGFVLLVAPKQETGNADILGSHSSQGSSHLKPEGWNQIVLSSTFQLGEDVMTDDGSDIAYLSFGTYPKIDGSTVAVPMAVEFAWQHLKMDVAEANMFVDFHTTHDAYMNLLNTDGVIYSGYYGRHHYDYYKPVDLVIATHPSEEELLEAKKANIELIIEPICFDAFVFITHVDNPVDSLTIEQIQKIYTGEITNWSEVGGNYEKIVAYQREANSGSQTGMEQLVMNGLQMADPITVKVKANMKDLVDVVGEYENETMSLGYTYLYYFENQYHNDDIKVLSINNIEPNERNIKSFDYPLTVNYYGVIRIDDKENIGGMFLEWMLSDEGQKCIEQAGYIALK